MVMDILWSVINDFWPARADEFSIESILPASLEGKVVIVTGATKGLGSAWPVKSVSEVLTYTLLPDPEQSPIK